MQRNKSLNSGGCELWVNEADTEETIIGKVKDFTDDLFEKHYVK